MDFTLIDTGTIILFCLLLCFGVLIWAVFLYRETDDKKGDPYDRETDDKKYW
jgi:hypothetical protein